MAEQPRDRPHLLIQGGGETEVYTSPRLPRSGTPPARTRAAHAQKLEQAIGHALTKAREQLSDRDPAIAAGERGFYLEFEVPTEHRVALDSLGDRRAGVELVAVRLPADGEATVTATVFVPESKADHFRRKVEQYRDEETKSGNPKNEALVARLEDARLGALRSLFVDPAHLFPAPDRPAWWEVWVRDGRLEVLRTVAERLNLTVGSHQVSFPERDVVLVLAAPEEMDRLAQHSDAIAELRLPKDSPRFFLEMPAIEQEAWAGDLADRAVLPNPLAPAICILDSGAARDHPLIRPGLEPPDQHTYDDAWGVGDSPYWNGHGTMMAGAALYGDLQEALADADPVALPHRLETVKVLPPRGQNDPLLYGAITEIGVHKAEARAPRRPRVVCMAVTSEVGLGRGRPSSWSAAVDKLAYGGGDTRRLIVLAAGNIRGDITAAEYPDANDLAEVDNPSQAWNALVVGACTDKTAITDPSLNGWHPVAPAGDLCPSSRTSTTWDRQWPIRPDVVFEGGNLAHDGVNPAVPVNDLQLVTTHYRPTVRMFDAFGDTSAATALVARISAGIMAERPELWPETVRGLIVHSAEWTPPMRARLDATEASRMAMLRRYGWGVPNLDRALRSAANDATLMVEDALLPFRREKSQIKTRDMHIHQLPWPREELEGLGEQTVELRVTLSYFIDPNPGERGWTRRHRYASHALRFEMKGRLEEFDRFRQRINKAARDEEEGGGGGTDEGDKWLLRRVRDRGSIHSDIWRGAAADLAARDAIGVYPIGGWWKEKPHLNRWDRPARYCLLVSIRAPEAEVDLYSAIATTIENRLTIVVPSS